MAEFLDGLQVGDLSFATIVFGVIIAIITGRLVPRRTYEDVLKDRDDWKATALRMLEINHKAVEAAEVTAAVVNSVPGNRPIPQVGDQS